MGGTEIKRAIEAATGYLQQHPDEAKYTDSVAVAEVVDGLVVRVTGPGGQTITTDMVQSVGGTATAPSPGWILRAAEASCVATMIAMRAAMLDVALETLEVTVDSVSDDRGILGIDEAVPAGPLSSRVSVRIRAPNVEPVALEQIARWGVAHRPVCDAIERQVPVAIEITAT